MRLEKLKDHHLILHALLNNESITATDLAPWDPEDSNAKTLVHLEFLNYRSVLSLLKKWAETEYIEMVPVPNAEKQLGGPKILFRITPQGRAYTSELADLLITSKKK